MSPSNATRHNAGLGGLQRALVLLLTTGSFLASPHQAKASEPTKCDPIEDVLNGKTPENCNTVTLENAKPTASGTGTDPDPDNTRGTRHQIPKDMWARMNGKSWHRKLRCPKRSTLALLRIPHWDFSYRPAKGQLIVAAEAADDILDVFAQLYEDGFPIAQMKPVHLFDGSDPKSMAANNTSAFNCRLKTSKRGLSEHSYGKAIDINPIQNPYVSRGRTQPRAGRRYASRKRRTHKGMILRHDTVVRAFRKIGWRWGGNWRSAKDYQHFSKSGK